MTNSLSQVAHILLREFFPNVRLGLQPNPASLQKFGFRPHHVMWIIAPQHSQVQTDVFRK